RREVFPEQKMERSLLRVNRRLVRDQDALHPGPDRGHSGGDAGHFDKITPRDSSLVGRFISHHTPPGSPSSSLTPLHIRIRVHGTELLSRLYITRAQECQRAGRRKRRTRNCCGWQCSSGPGIGTLTTAAEKNHRGREWLKLGQSEPAPARRARGPRDSE